MTECIASNNRGEFNENELKLIDWSNLLCLLCRRKFVSHDQLCRHEESSELHKTNLAKLMKSRSEESGKSDGEFGYRDRARERRLKYGQPETPRPEKAHVHEVVPSPVSKKTTINSQESIGAKMMKNMGWSEGQGLGKDGKSRSSVIEVQRRTGQAGLGVKTTTSGAEESYKDAVRRAMRQRFKELSEKD